MAPCCTQGQKKETEWLVSMAYRRSCPISNTCDHTLWEQYVLREAGNNFSLKTLGPNRECQKLTVELILNACQEFLLALLLR